MDSKIVVNFREISKYYKLYHSPKDRLKEALDPFKRKLHKEFYALRDINLEIHQGEILGIVGKNGAGKSTLLKMISGIIQPNSGQIRINGEVSALLDIGSGLNPDYTGIQNIYFQGFMKGLSKSQIISMMDDIVAFADIGEFIHQPLRTYSSGMRARLGFALSTTIRPDILIIDEVLSVGDEIFRRKCFARMSELINSGSTVIYVSHNMQTVIELCRRSILLDQGEIILDGSPKQIAVQYHRLQFAKNNEYPQIRNEIKAMLNHGGSDLTDRVEACPTDSSILSDQPLVQQAFYIPSYVSKTKTVTRGRDVDIFDSHIRTQQGRMVNMLVMNEVYIYSFKVRFNQDIQNINYIVAFANIKGTVLTSGFFPSQREFIHEPITTGTMIEVNCRFTCRFLPGAYFVSSILRFLLPDESLAINKEHDAFAFKVQASGNRKLGGFFTADQHFNIIRLEPD